MKHIPIEDCFDLHSFLPEDVLSALDAYLIEASRRGLSEVRIIHGKGKGVRRAEVRRALANRPDVREAYDAPPGRGSTGATIVILKAKGSTP